MRCIQPKPLCSSIIFRFSYACHRLKKFRVSQSCFNLFSSLSAIFSELNVSSCNTVTPIDSQLISICEKSPFQYNEAVSLFERSIKANVLPAESACNILVRKLSESAKPELAFSVYNRMLIANMVPQLMSFNALIECIIGTGNKHLVMCSVGIILKRGYIGSTTLMYTILRYLCLNSGAVSACMFFHGMRINFESLDIGAFGDLIDDLCQKNRLDEASNLIAGMKGISCCSNFMIYNTAILCYCKHGRINESMCLLEEMKKDGLRVDLFLYEKLFYEASKSGSPDIRRVIFRKILEDGLSPLFLVSLFYKFSLWKEMPELLSSVVESGIQPNNYTYQFMFENLCREGDNPRKAMDILKASNCFSNFMMYETAILCYCKHGRITEAMCFLEEMNKEGFRGNLFLYGTLLHEASKNESPDIGRAIFRKMLGDGLSPSLYHYNCLISLLCKFSLWKEVTELLNSMAETGIQPNNYTYWYMIDNLCRQGNPRKAAGILHLSLEKGAKPILNTCNSLLMELLFNGYVKNAMKLFSSLLQDHSYVQLNSDTVTTLFRFNVLFSTMIHGICRLGMINIAQGLLIKMKSYGCRPRVRDYNNLLSCLFKASSMEEGKRLFQRIRASGDCVPNIISYTILMDAFLVAGDLQSANAVLKEMSQRGLAPDAVTYSTLVFRLSRKGKMKDAKSVFDRMIASGCIPVAFEYNSMLFGYLLVKDREEIIRLLHEMAAKHVVLDSLTIDTILLCLCHISDDMNVLDILPDFSNEMKNGESISCGKLLEIFSTSHPALGVVGA